MNLALLVGAHLVGDFVLQNHWMQSKGRSSFVCSIHVLFYSLPFVVLCLNRQLGWLVLAAILVQHWLQDRFELHRKWMTAYKQTAPDKWPTGPLCVDQAFHIGFLWLICAFTP